MGREKDPRDEKLIEELYEKLDWYTFVASNEEYDAKKVEAILNLLEELDPWPESIRRQVENYGRTSEERVDEAFDRFKKKYKLTDEDIASKNTMSPPPGTEDIDSIRLEELENSAELGLDPELIKELIAKERKIGERKNALTQTLKEKSDTASITESYSGKAEETNESEKSGRRRVRFISGVWAKIAVACIVVVVMGVVFTTAGSAVQQKSFFETVQDGYNSFKMIVTGNEMEVETMEQEENDIVYYDSWEQVQEENKDILVPTYIPEGVRLKELCGQDMGGHFLYKGTYADDAINYLSITVKYFRNNYANVEEFVFEEWKYLYEDKKIKFYQFNDEYAAVWKNGKGIYAVEWVDLDELAIIIEQMKQ